MFFTDLGRIVGMSADQPLKPALIANLCNGLDITPYCPMEFDRRGGTAIIRWFLEEANISSDAADALNEACYQSLPVS